MSNNKSDKILFKKKHQLNFSNFRGMLAFEFKRKNQYWYRYDTLSVDFGDLSIFCQRTISFDTKLAC